MFASEDSLYSATPLDDETLLMNPLMNPGWINVEALASFRLLPVPANEPFGANVMRLEQGVLVNAFYTLTLNPR